MFQYPILNTRLYKPEIKSHYVFRKEIIEILEANRSKHLTLVSAPTGYGKSVTISEWLDATKTKHCWISLDDELNELRFFLYHLTFCVKDVFPDSFQTLSMILEGEQLPNEKTISNYLINEFDEIGEELILVLDDYHSVNNPQIHAILDELLKYCPPKFHLVIITRRDPPLKINILRSYGAINEIRMSELSFTAVETISLAKNLTNIKLSEKLLKELMKKTEGWIVGLRLALLTMTEEKDLEKTIEEIGGDKHYFTQYLLEEVFKHQEKEVQEILLIASIFDRFNKELLKFVIENRPSISQNTDYSVYDNLFDRFKNSSLFIIPLDSNGEWYRYHHFFKEFLIRRLKSENTKDQINELHRKGSEYFDKNAYFEEAIQHSLIAGNLNSAVKIIVENKYKLIDTDKLGRLHTWLGKLPGGTVEKHLGLLLARAFLYDTVKDFTSMKNDLIIAEKLIARSKNDITSQNQLLGEFHTVSSNWNFSMGNFQEAYKHSVKARDLLTDSSAYLREYAFAHQAFSLTCLGKFEDAFFISKEALRNLSPSDSISRLRYLIIQSMLYSFKGNLPDIMKLALEYYSIGTEKKFWVSLSYATYYLSETSYQWNDLDKAVDYAKNLGDHYYSGRPPWVLQTLFTKAFALNALKNYEELNQTIIEIKEVTENINKEVFHNFTRAFEVELAIRQNDNLRAFELAKKTNFESFLPIFYFYFPQITFIKLLMSTDEPDKIAEAEKRLKELIELGRTAHRHNILMQALLLQSLLFSKKDNFESASKTLKEAIKLAEPGGFIRIFIDLGEPMKTIIRKVYRGEPDHSYISKLLQAFEKEKATTNSIRKLHGELPTALNLNGLEKLSVREIDLLRLISEGYRNKEIAVQFNLSLDSIKKYLYYIYQKLGVNNRVAAISKATELGLINQLDKIQ